MLDIRIIGNSEGEKHQEYIKKNPKSNFYAYTKYLDLVSTHLDAEASWIIAKRGGDIVGMLPFMRKEGPIGPVYNSMAYYGSNGGVIQDTYDYEAKKALVETFYTIAKEECACSATIITNPLEEDYDFYEKNSGYTYSDDRIGLITHFPTDRDEKSLMSMFKDPRPRNIRRAIKAGVKVYKTKNKQAIEFLFKTHKKNMSDIGGKNKTKDFFNEIPNVLGKNDWNIYLAKIGPDNVAALLVFYFNKTVEYYTPCIVENYRKTQALSLVVYNAMLDAMDNDYKYWNWGGTWSSQQGVFEYKKRWGSTCYKYKYFTKEYNVDLRKNGQEFYSIHYQGFYVVPYREIDQELESKNCNQ